MDIILPKIDGPEVIQFARMKYPEPGLPIIILSGAVIGSTMVQVSVSVLEARGEISGWTLALVESAD